MRLAGYDVLSKALLQLLDGRLRRWASSRIVDLVVGPKMAYAAIEGGWCGFALTPPCPYGEVEAGLWEQLTPRALARRVNSPVSAAAALAAASAASSAYIYSVPGSVRPVDRLGGRFIVVEGCRWVSSLVDGAVELSFEQATILAKRGLTVPMIVCDHVLSLDPAKALELGRWGAIIAAPLHPDLARTLGFHGLVGLHPRPELCPHLRRLASLGHGPEKLMGRGLVVYADLQYARQPKPRPT
jgi:hypothetical protein